MDDRNMFIDFAFIFNTIAAADLATQGARASAAMLLTYFSLNSAVSASEWVIMHLFI